MKDNFIFILAIVVGTGVSWLAGWLFNITILRHDFDLSKINKRLEPLNKYFEPIITIAIGFFLVMAMSAVINEMGCSSEE
jgi:hypothetical protein